MVTEILNNIAILSQKRQEELSYFNVSLFFSVPEMESIA